MPPQSSYPLASGCARDIRSQDNVRGFTWSVQRRNNSTEKLRQGKKNAPLKARFLLRTMNRLTEGHGYRRLPGQNLFFADMPGDQRNPLLGATCQT
jgi:hypothetical protein